MSDEEIGEEHELDDEGRLPCGHTPEEHGEIDRMHPVGGVNLTMALPVESFDSRTGEPHFDLNPDTGFALLIDVQIPGPHALNVAQHLLTEALRRVEGALAADPESAPLSDEQIEHLVNEFDPDEAISGLLNGTYDIGPEDLQGGREHDEPSDDTERWEDEGGHG